MMCKGLMKEAPRVKAYTYSIIFLKLSFHISCEEATGWAALIQNLVFYSVFNCARFQVSLAFLRCFMKVSGPTQSTF